MLRAKWRHKALIVTRAHFGLSRSNPANGLGGQTQIEREWQALDQRSAKWRRVVECFRACPELIIAGCSSQANAEPFLEAE
jgi:hypothetical protein